MKYPTFPLSDVPGANNVHINQQRMRQMAQNRKRITPAQLNQIIAQHRLFLESGGAGGNWTTIVVNGVVIGIYDGGEMSKGEQARLEHQQLSNDCSLDDQLLSFANFCGLYAPGLRASKTDMSYSLITDAFLPKTNFQGAVLKKADFSRTILIGADFRGADLRYVDFENCDLTKTDFRGARLEGARFPGATLDGVVI